MAEDEPEYEHTAGEVLARVAAGERVRMTMHRFQMLLEEDISPSDRMELRARARRTDILVEDR